MKNNVIEGLRRSLAETYGLYLTTQKCHWNVEGPDFSSLHLMFQTQYTLLADYIDILAERIRSLGDYSPGSFAEFEELSNVPQLEEMKVLPQKMIQVLLKGYEVLNQTLKHTIMVAEKSQDVGTVDILTGQMEQHDKTMWMLRSTLK
ncbi:MAG: Dps family protein [Alphaproteobacteria bacterium]